jgi:hypothetical protein
MRGAVRRLPLLAVVVAGCGGDKLDLRTPGVKPKPAHAVPSPTPSPRPVTREEEAVIRGWADALRHGHVAAAARYFALPVVVANDAAPMRLTTRKDVRFFNETLPCGAKLVSTERAEHDYVVATFRLTERPGGAGCGNGAGALARTAFLIRHHHITQWVRVPDEAPATGSTS